ncbi:hypothetical protein [Streptomyces sioyaensis]|uniref:hypothetical protein n=1 Tax=Streptomyces sioyaensis TaxID=67364 RepID=UPI003D75A168
MSQDPPAHSSTRNIRRGYAVAGAVFAVIWIGGTSEPAWAHAARTTFLMLTLSPTLLWANRRLTAAFHESAHPGRALARLITARVLIVATAVAASALFVHLLDPHIALDAMAIAVPPLLVLLTAPLQIRGAYRARARGIHPSARPELSAARLIPAKLTLVAAALLAQTLLDPYLASAQLLIAAATVVTVTAVGPKLHTKLLTTRAPQATGQTSPARTTA